MAKKEMEWVPFDYNEVEGFSLLKEAKTTSERKRAFNEIEKYYRENPKQQGYWLRLVIDLIRCSISEIDDSDGLLNEMASVKLQGLITGLTKSMLKKKSLMIEPAKFVETVETIVDDVFIKVITEYDPIKMMYQSKPPVSIVAFCEKNRKYAMSEFSAEESGNSNQNYKVDQRVKRAAKAIEARGGQPTINNIMKEIEREKRARAKKEFLDEDKISNNISVAVVALSMQRQKMFDERSSIYMEDSVAPNIEMAEDITSEDFEKPETHVMKDERKLQIMEALHALPNTEGVQMYLMSNGFVEKDDQLYIVPPEHIKDVAEKFNTSIINAKRTINAVHLTLKRMLEIKDDDMEKDEMTPIDKLLSKTLIPFTDKDNETKEAEEDFLSIIEINDF